MSDIASPTETTSVDSTAANDSRRFRARRWSVANLSLPPSQGDAKVEVLRLALTNAGITALLDIREGSKEFFIAAWEPSNKNRWTMSPALQLKPSQHVSSIGPSTAQGQFVVLSNASSISSIEEMSGPKNSWVSLPSLKQKIATVAFGPNGAINAFTSSGTVLNDYVLRTRSKVWHLAQRVHVDILYGSSS